MPDPNYQNANVRQALAPQDSRERLCQPKTGQGWEGPGFFTPNQQAWRGAVSSPMDQNKNIAGSPGLLPCYGVYTDQFGNSQTVNVHAGAQGYFTIGGPTGTVIPASRYRGGF